MTRVIYALTAEEEENGGGGGMVLFRWCCRTWKQLDSQICPYCKDFCCSVWTSWYWHCKITLCQVCWSWCSRASLSVWKPVLKSEGAHLSVLCQAVWVFCLFLILQGSSLALWKLYLGNIGTIQPVSQTPAICRIRCVTLHLLADTCVLGGRVQGGT